MKEKLNFCTAEELVDVKISHDEYCNFLRAIKTIPEVKEMTIVSTCNRFETLLDVDDSFAEQDLLKLRKVIAEITGSNIDFNYLLDDDARLQIIRTYAGLNSGLVLEDEICAQMGTSIRQSAMMGFAGPSLSAVLEDSIKTRKFLEAELFDGYDISYCDIALTKSFEKFGYQASDIASLTNVMVLGSGSTSKKSCLSLIKLGVKPQSITVMHRISKSAVQIEDIKSCPELAGVNFVRSKDGYHVDKAKEIMNGAELVVFGIDTKKTVADFAKDCKTKIVDFNSNASCGFETGYDMENYVSNLDADSFVRRFSSMQIEDDSFVDKIKTAEQVITSFIKTGKLEINETVLV